MGALAASLKRMKMPLTWCCKNPGAKSHWKYHAGRDLRRSCDLAPLWNRVRQTTTSLGAQPVPPLTRDWAFRTGSPQGWVELLLVWKQWPGTTGLDENEKNPARKILRWLEVPSKLEFQKRGRKPELRSLPSIWAPWNVSLLWETPGVKEPVSWSN